MTKNYIAAAILAAFVSGTTVVADDCCTTDPLFASQDVLALHVSGPMTTLTRDRPDDVDLPGSASWQEADGSTVTVDVGIRARGNYRRRRETCRFPPVRLNFRKDDVADTLFHKQDVLKLVTHCRDRSSRYEQLVLREYLVYRMLNVLTDLSYRVRLLRITYTDTESDADDRNTIAFVIEHKSRFEKRTGLPVVEIESTRVDRLAPDYANLMAIFQYMIGNTDFSPIAGAAGEECCHNVHLFGSEERALFPIPYDFDMSGMINAPYASPNPRFDLRNVRQRLYRGRCVNNDLLPPTLSLFRERREQLYELVANEPLLTNGTRRSMTSYLNSFFKEIDNEAAFIRQLTRECVPSA